MSHEHHRHHAHRPAKGRVLTISLAVTAAFVVFEAVAGFRAGSLALLSDAGHNFTDAFALLLAAIGVYLETRPADHIKTYGYERAGILVAFVNAIVLVALAGFLIYESYGRLMHPRPVAEVTMIVVAAVGLAVNLGIAFGIGQGHDLNLRAAWMHMIGDAASSAGIIAGAIAIRFTGWIVIDPVLSLLIAIGIVWSAWGIIQDSLNILLEGLPKGLKLADVLRDLGKVEGVIDVHDLHIWSLGTEAHALSCHVLIEDMPHSASNFILCRINQVLSDHFHIHHTTIQFEHTRCALADASCTEIRRAQLQ
ncbi:MAG TPA: cation diffusion facilitator family transporter [Bryobacteraceae bacterium]|nr:cation diffusion facilitator family transporter [Bryobacteraceae bacterium]